MQDLNCVEQFKEIKPKPTVEESMEAYRKLENAEHKPKKKDGRQNCRHHYPRKQSRIGLII